MTAAAAEALGFSDYLNKMRELGVCVAEVCVAAVIEQA